MSWPTREIVLYCQVFEEPDFNESTEWHVFDGRNGIGHGVSALGFGEFKAWKPSFRDVEHGGALTIHSDPSEICALGGSFESDSGHAEWVDGRVYQTGFTTTFTPNRKILCEVSGVTYDVDFTNIREGKEAAATGQATVAARSYHQRGVNVSMMAGSIRFVTNSIDLDSWRN